MSIAASRVKALKEFAHRSLAIGALFFEGSSSFVSTVGLRFCEAKADYQSLRFSIKHPLHTENKQTTEAGHPGRDLSKGRPVWDVEGNHPTIMGKSKHPLRAYTIYYLFAGVKFVCRLSNVKQHLMFGVVLAAFGEQYVDRVLPAQFVKFNAFALRRDVALQSRVCLQEHGLWFLVQPPKPGRGRPQFDSALKRARAASASMEHVL